MVYGVYYTYNQGLQKEKNLTRMKAEKLMTEFHRTVKEVVLKNDNNITEIIVF